MIALALQLLIILIIYGCSLFGLWNLFEIAGTLHAKGKYVLRFLLGFLFMFISIYAAWGGILMIERYQLSRVIAS